MLRLLSWLTLMYITCAVALHVPETASDVTLDSSLILELIKRVDTLESRDRNQQSEIDKLRSELSASNKENHKLREVVQHQGAALKKLQDACRQVPHPSMNLTTTPVKSYNKQRARASTGTSINKRLLLNSAGEPGLQVAFFAKLTATIPHAGQHQNIVFDNVETNVGDAYNEHQGVFVAPVSGVYFFTSSILASNDREVWCELTVNAVGVARIYARGTDNRHDQGTMSMVVRLEAGDDVSVQNLDPDDAIYGGGATSYTAFSGFLLWKE